MKFLINPTAESLSRARAPVRVFLGFTAVLLAAAVAQRIVGGGFDPAELELAYRPDGPGRQALNAPLIWEELHQGAFLYGFLLLMLGSLLVICPLAPRVKNVLLWGTFAAVLGDLLAPAAIALGLPAALRVLTFVAATGMLAACLAVTWARFGVERRARR